MADEKDDQPLMFEQEEWWEEHWKGMPEFVQDDLWEGHQEILVRIPDTPEGRAAFGKAMSQTITENTKSIWYPAAEIGRFKDKRYIDAEPARDEDQMGNWPVR